MATKSAKGTQGKKRGRPPVPRKRLGHLERKTIETLLRSIRAFTLTATDAPLKETSINSRLIKQLKLVNANVVNRKIESVTFVEETYRPECTLSGGGAYTLFALECKKLHDHSAKRLFKEGLAQASLYLSKSKRVALVLYDFTTGRVYAKAFGKGNSNTSRFSARVREETGLHIIVRPAP